jgi:hypothetical protein
VEECESGREEECECWERRGEPSAEAGKEAYKVPHIKCLI